MDSIIGGYICNICGQISLSEIHMLDHVTKEHHAKVSKHFPISEHCK